MLRGLTASVGAGDAVAVIGRNAAGKTTLLRAMAGLIRARTGEVRLDGNNVAMLAPRQRARRLAFVAQRPIVAAAFTVRESVALGSFARGSDLPRVAVELDRFGLTECADRPFHALSVGQQQRAALARAFVQADARSLLFVDEPFAAMDLGETSRCLGHLRKHAENGGAVVAVLHDLAQATALASRVWLIDDGRLAADGAAVDVLQAEKLTHWFGVPFDVGPHGPIARLH